MNRQPVLSSNLRSVGWENNILEIEFNSGSVYQYYNVPIYVYEALIDAPSKGKYFNENIKWEYSYEKV